VADREPQDADARPNGDMTHPSERGDHANHDLFLIVAATDRAADERTRADARRQMDACADCATLFNDIRAISTGLGSMPKTIAAPRDFRLTTEQAARLNRNHGWRRLLRPFASGATPSLKPLGNAFAALGIAGLLFATVLPGVGGFAGGAASSAPGGLLSTVGSAVGAPGSSNDGRSSAEFGPVTSNPPAVPAAGAPGPGSTASTDNTYGVNRDLQAKGATPVPTPTQPPSALFIVMIVSAALLAAGVALFALRLAANRLL
jgi:hypothetical protein